MDEEVLAEEGCHEPGRNAKQTTEAQKGERVNYSSARADDGWIGWLAVVRVGTANQSIKQ